MVIHTVYSNYSLVLKSGSRRFGADFFIIKIIQCQGGTNKIVLGSCQRLEQCRGTHASVERLVGTHGNDKTYRGADKGCDDGTTNKDPHGRARVDDLCSKVLVVTETSRVVIGESNVLFDQPAIQE